MSAAKKLTDLYEIDELLWYEENAKLIREKKFEKLDYEHIAEALETMGKHEIDRLLSHLAILFMHILKYIYQPERRCKSWELSIDEQRDQAVRMLKNYPSLKGYMEEVVKDAYKLARIKAAKETFLDKKTFPEIMPFLMEQALQEDWLPD